MKKISLITLFVFFLFSINNNAFSQFVNATSNDMLAANNPSVQNTGNDVRNFGPQHRNMRIMTWDGDQPGFYWNDDDNGISGLQDLDGNNLGQVTDPDIVLSSFGGNMRTLIVYILNDNVYYETWRYNVGSWSLSQPATAITTNNGCSCPNMDVDIDNKTVVVWEEDTRIYATAGDIDGNFGPNLFICGDSHTPDVALNHDPNSGTTYATFVFLSDNGTNFNLAIIGATHTNIHNGTTMGAPTIIGSANLSNNQYFGKPRIAGPTSFGLNFETEVVVEFFDGSRYFIQGYNTQSNPPTLFNINISPSYDLSGAINKDPAVGYSGDHIVITWTYDDTYSGLLNGNQDVLSRQLIYNGTAPNLPVYNVFSVVNTFTNGTQGISSIAGRWHSTSVGDEKLVTFFNEDNNEVNYKVKGSGATQFRLMHTPIEADIYPNPAANNLSVNIRRLPNRKARALQYARTITYSKANFPERV